MILLAFSVKDTAGANIAEKVLENYPFDRTSDEFQENPVYSAKINAKAVRLIALKEEAVYAQNLEDFFPDLELVVFLSRHSSASGTPTLSVHTPGNFGVAELGGLPQTLSVCPAEAMSNALKALDRLRREMQLEFEISYECTHHGPSLDAPTMFVELGSTPTQWRNLKAAEAVAIASMEAASNFESPSCNVVLGIGGPHYNRKFTQMALDGKATFGHIIPKYALNLVNTEVLKHCVDRTLEKTTSALLDWKGIGGNAKPRVIEALAAINLPYEKV
jgi:D-aminoacyl-tRNA deacylase